jgi:hypothetical protein
MSANLGIAWHRGIAGRGLPDATGITRRRMGSS